jgi:cobalt-zinc-cadmium efflux system outer membrane protein
VRSIAALVRERAGEVREAGVIPNPTVTVSRVEQLASSRMTVNQPLSWLVRRGPAMQAARFALDGARYDSARTTADFLRDVRTAFFAALAGREQARLADEEAMLADSLAALAARRAAAGDISELERDQIAQDGLRARLIASEARVASHEASSVLAHLLGWPGAQPPVPAGALDDGLTGQGAALDPGDVDALPSVRGPMLAARAAAGVVRSLEWTRLPIPGFYLERDWNTLVPGTTRVGVSLPIPLFTLGSEAIATARARATRLEAEAADARFATRRRVTVAATRMNEAAARALLARDSLAPQARHTREGVVRLYDAGRASVLDVLGTLRTEREARATLISSLLGFQQARAELDAALGIIR